MFMDKKLGEINKNLEEVKVTEEGGKCRFQ